MELKNNKYKCPICSGWFKSVNTTSIPLNLQKHIGVGFSQYGHSKKSSCYGSFLNVNITKERAIELFEKEKDFWNSEIKRINKLKEERI
jgi:hypothetical protein